MNLQVVPVSLRDANAYVAQKHRHHGPTRGHKFSIGVTDGEQLRGVAIVGRPLARKLDNGQIAEVLRVCSDGTPNVCSMLLGACRRAALAMGYKKIVTYTLNSESGASLKAAGFKATKRVSGASWSRQGREREDKHPLDDKIRWESP